MTQFMIYYAGKGGYTHGGEKKVDSWQCAVGSQ